MKENVVIIENYPESQKKRKQSSGEAEMKEKLKTYRKLSLSNRTRFMITLGQWICFLLHLTLVILSFVDVFEIGNDPKEWVGDDDDEIINGVKQKTGSIPSTVYVALCGVHFLIACLTFFIEWYIYHWNGIGFDLRSDFYIDCDKKRRKNAEIECILKARDCHTITGVNYLNYYKGLTPLSIFFMGMIIVTLSFERDTSRLAPIFVFSFVALVLPTWFVGQASIKSGMIIQSDEIFTLNHNFSKNEVLDDTQMN